MTYNPLSRRQFVGVMAASLAATWIAGPGRPEFASAGRVLAPAQLRDVEAMVALIIPTDDTPGAHVARVADFIDRDLASFAADQRPLFDAGLADLNARVARRHPETVSFADLGEVEATDLLRELDSEKSEYFEAVRVGTITGFLANPEYGGNSGKVGRRLINFEDRFAWSAPFGWYDADASRGQ